MTTSKRKPCAECPFSRAAKPGSTGVADPTVYVGQGVGPFWLPCHMDPHYSEATKRDTSMLQCAGAAAFRANLGVDRLMPAALLHCEADRELVFAAPAELIAHHKQITIEEAEAILKETPPIQLLKIELGKVGVEFIAPEDIKG